MTPPTTDVSSMRLESEYEELFREHSAMLYRTAYSLLDSAADAEDVLQTVFLRLLRSGLPHELKRNARGYLYRAAVNASLDAIRARKRRSSTEQILQAHPLAASDSDSVEETHRRLAEALAELHPEAAQIVVLKYVHGYHDGDIARILGTSRGAIAMRLLRSRSVLKQLMRDLGESR